MSTALAIAGVTAVLRDLLNDGLINHNVAGIIGSSVTVSVGPPDRVVPANGTEASQLNLFLHQVTPNAGWRNEGLPARDPSGRQRLANPPLALDLHYLVSAYGGADLHGEILLGYAMQLLHETPVLTRAAIRAALNPSPDVGGDLPPALRALAEAGLDAQIEALRITPAQLDGEEMSKLWTAIQSHLRPSAAYRVSVVLIEGRRPVRAPLPVLTRGPIDPASGRERGVVVAPGLVPALPTIERVAPADGQPAMRLDQPVDLIGHHLDGADRTVQLANDRFEIDAALAASGASEPGRIRFEIPAASADDFPVGAYRVGAQLRRPGEGEARETNRLGVTLAPDLVGLPLAVARAPDGRAAFTLSFRPALRAGQQVALLLGTREIAPEPFTTPTTSLDFVVADAPLGSHLARLRIDGIDSPIIDRTAAPPVFLDRRITIT
jgi:hypothetical protein